MQRVNERGLRVPLFSSRLRDRAATLLVVGALVVLVGCGGAGGERADQESQPSRTGDPSSRSSEGWDEPLFEDRGAEIGFDFVHWSGATGRLYFHEIVGSGAALFDMDGDGDLDAWLVQGAQLDDGEPIEPAPERAGDRLLRNEMEPGRPETLRFVDVSERAGLVPAPDEEPVYGMGIATGDIDNDGDIDVYVTGFGRNRLWRNDGALRFVEVAIEAGANDERWSTSAAFADFDRDGYLDLYVANYVDFRLAIHRVCHQPSGRPDYCGPQSYSPVSDRLLRNRGAEAPGTFEDISGAAGILAAQGSGLGVVAADFDHDGWIDLYVANDQRPNHLWRHRGLGPGGVPRFTDEALIAGAAVNLRGSAEASMGVEAADFDGDGDLDLFLTHLMGETHTLYANDGTGHFLDETRASLGPAASGATGFGTAAIDIDHDGYLDLVMANGSVSVIEELAGAGDPFPLHMPNRLVRNLGPDPSGAARFQVVEGPAAEVFSASHVSRGLARGDIDDDGDLDLLVTNNRGPARLLSRISAPERWIGLALLLPVSGGRRHALGARVVVEPVEGEPIYRRVHTDGSYLSAHDPRVLVSLGERRGPFTARVHWPDGEEEVFSDLDAGRYHELVRGEGEASP